VRIERAAIVALLGLSLAACPKGETTSEPTPPVGGAPDDASVSVTFDAGAPDARELPDAPTQAETDAAMEKIQRRVTACNKAGFTGTVTVILDVFHYGEVDRVQIKGAPDTTLAECIARVAQRAKFGRSKKGGRVSYDFAFE
jgi:hypothetical protein